MNKKIYFIFLFILNNKFFKFIFNLFYLIF